MPRVIVNSTPLILLAGIDMLDIFAELYGKVAIPQEVFNEVTAKADSASRALLARLDWLIVECAPELPDDYRRLISAKLHVGELEVMALALATGVDAVVLDDNAARRTAKFFGLPVTGTLGLLLRAKERGIVPEVEPLINALLAKGFRVDDRVVGAVLELAHER